MPIFKPLLFSLFLATDFLQKIEPYSITRKLRLLRYYNDKGYPHNRQLQKAIDDRYRKRGGPAATAFQLERPQPTGLGQQAGIFEAAIVRHGDDHISLLMPLINIPVCFDHLF